MSNFGQAVLLTALAVLGLVILSFFPDWVTDILVGIVGVGIFLVVVVCVVLTLSEKK